MGKSYFRVMFALYGVALVVCGACRLYLRLFCIDVDSGFYTGGAPFVLVFNIILAASVLAMLALSRFRLTDCEFPLAQSGLGGSVLPSLVCLTIVLFVLEDTGWLRLLPMRGMPLEGNLRVLLCGVLGCLAALFFLATGLRGLMKISGAPNGLLALFPALWQIVLIVAKFNSYTTLTTISDNLLTVLFLVSACVFMVGYARTVCGFSRKDGRNYTIPTGLAASLFGFLLTIPNYVYMLVHRAPMPAPALGYMESAYILVLSVFTLVTVVRLRRAIAFV